MEPTRWLERARSLGWTERLCAVFVVLSLGFTFTGHDGSMWALLVRLLAIVTGIGVAWKLGVRAIRKAIWRLRNRLIVAYLFIAVVPVILLAALTISGAWVVSGQVAAYLLNMEMDRRVGSMRQLATSLGRVPAPARAEALRRGGYFYRERYPGLEVLVVGADGAETRYPDNSDMVKPPGGHDDTAGIVIREKRFHLWAHSTGPEAEVTVVAPLTKNYLQGLVPALGVIQLAPIGLSPQEVRDLDVHVHPGVEGEPQVTSSVAPAVNYLDFRLKWGVRLAAPVWEKPGDVKTVILGVVTRISGPLKIVFSVDTSNDVPTLLVGFAAFALGFLVLEMISAYIGISLSRTITSAVHDLYEATVRIREGDLSHRIQVMGNDQLAELGTSFNIMAGNLERLIQGEKERQKMQAELEIAREVQAQLHPKPLEGLGTLRIASVCNAARMVSGDYFDYQAMGETRLALAIGDVAGKGISAALLMATLQSAMRSQLRHCAELEQAAAVGLGEGYTTGKVSTAALVSNLNQQVYASTAPEKYATFFFSVYDEAASTLTYTNAGHLSPLLIRGGKVLSLDSNGMVVGALPFARYGESTVKLEKGDLLLCYTDGITEPENAYGEMFGEERLTELLLANEGRPGDEIAALIAEEVTKWTSSTELQDDMTLLVAWKV